MLWLPLFVMLVPIFVAVPSVGQPDKTITFSKESAGKLPTGWKVAKTGKEDGSAWSVVADDTAPGKTGFTLMQTNVSPGTVFNLCVLEDSNFQDVEAIV